MDLFKILPEGQLCMVWLMQTGAPPHIARGTIGYLKKNVQLLLFWK